MATGPIQFSSVQFGCSVVSDSATPWIAAPRLSITNSQSLLKLMSIAYNHLILYHPLLLWPSIFPSIRVCSNESVLWIRQPKYWSFSFSISPSNEYSGPITAWQIKREKVEVVTDFLFLGSKITADSHCSHEIRRRLLLGRKAMANLDSCCKTETLLLDKGPYSQDYGLPSGHTQL